jgi:hypothetical protein
MVEGYCTTFTDNELKHAFKIMQHVFCGNSHSSNSCVRQPLVSTLVRVRQIPKFMNFPVDLDAQARLVAIEV